MNAPTRLTRDQVSDLLVRYPYVSDAEAKLILTFLRHGRHLDVGMLTANQAVKAQLDSFMEDHKRHFRIGIGEGSAVVGAIAAFLAICWFIFEAMAPVTS